MGKRRKGGGHFCWCCERFRPNERFSGSGHRRHLCRECSKLGTQELAYRSAVRNLSRPRRGGYKLLVTAARTHADERVRAYASELLNRIQMERAQIREDCLAEEQWELITMAEERAEFDFEGADWYAIEDWELVE